MRISDWSSDVCSSDLIVDAHYALHKGPICEEASHIAQFEDERRVQSALLDRIWTVTVGAISFKMTLIAVEVVDVIEKMIKLASPPLLALQVLTRLWFAGQVGLGFESFCGHICLPIGRRSFWKTVC